MRPKNCWNFVPNCVIMQIDRLMRQARELSRRDTGDNRREQRYIEQSAIVMRAMGPESARTSVAGFGGR